MKLRHFLLASASALLLTACGGGSDDAPQSKTSIAAKKGTSKSPLDRTFAIKDAAALDIEALFALLPYGVKVTYDDVSFDKKTGATIVSNLKVAANVETENVSIKPQEFDGLEIGRAEFYGVNMDVFEKLGSKDGALDASLETAFEKLRLFDITGEGSEDSATAGLTIGALEFDKLAIREGGLPDDASADPTAALFNSFSLAGIYLQDVSARAGEEQFDLSFSAPDLRFIGLAGGKVASFIANDIEYETNQTQASMAELGDAMGPAAQVLLNGPFKNFIAPDNQRTTMETVEWKNIDFSGLMEYGLKGERPPFSATNLIDLGSMSALNTKSFIGDRMFSFVPETSIPTLEFTWLAPSKIRAEAKGGVYDFTAYTTSEQEEVIALLTQYDLDQIKADSVMSYDWDAKKGGADFVTNFDADGLADFKMNIAFEGLMLEKIEAATEAGDANPVAGLAAFEGMNIEVADDKMLDVIFELAGLQGGMTAKTARQTAVGGLQIARLQAMQLGGPFNDYIDAAVGFLEDGGTLMIDASPEQVVPISVISAAGAQGPQALPDLLNLTVTHEE